MKYQDFYKEVEKREGLSWGEHPDEDKVMVVCKSNNTACVFSKETISENWWPDLENIIYQRREPDVLSQMTRVVGYYSRIDNWNPSKQGELIDRHKGNYTVKEV